MYLNSPVNVAVDWVWGLTLTLDVFKCKKGLEKYGYKIGLTLTLDVFKLVKIIFTFPTLTWLTLTLDVFKYNIN